MKTLISLFVSFLVSVAAEAATIIQVINTNTGEVAQVQQSINADSLDLYWYRDNNKLSMSFSTFHPEWNNWFIDIICTIAAPTGENLQTGSYYTGLSRYMGLYDTSNPDRPKMEWGFIYERGSSDINPESSWFRVIEVNYTSPGFYDRMAFDAYDGNNNLISVRYNSDIALPIPEPGPVLLSSLSLLFFRRRRRKLEEK